MDPLTVTKLKALNLAAINERLQAVARTWARRCVDGLATAESLESLQGQYAELLQCLPPSAPDELEPILTQYARALRLKGDKVTVSQNKFFLAHTGARYQSPNNR